MFPVIKYYSITYLLVSYWQITLPTFFPFPSMCPAPSKDKEVYQCYKQKIWVFFFFILFYLLYHGQFPIWGFFFSSKESLSFLPSTCSLQGRLTEQEISFPESIQYLQRDFCCLEILY